MSAPEHGYTYTGDTGNTYLVTMLNRDTKRGTARVQVERCLSGGGTIPDGVTVTVPLRKVQRFDVTEVTA